MGICWGLICRELLGTHNIRFGIAMIASCHKQDIGRNERLIMRRAVRDQGDSKADA